MKIATTTCDFKGYFHSMDVCRILPLMAESGFRHIDLNLWDAYYQDSPLLKDDWEAWADDVLATGERLGLDFVQAHASDGAYFAGPDREQRVELLKRELKVCRKLGIRGMVVHAVYRPQGTREEFMDVNAAFYKELMPAAAESGVQVYTENTCEHNCPTYYILDGADVNELCERVAVPEFFGCCWDIGHAHIQKVDQRQCLNVMGSNLRAVHIHDNMGNADSHIQPYSGNLNFDAVLAGLKDIGFDSYFTLEAFSLPLPSYSCRRQGDKLLMPSLSIKVRGERLMYDVARFMLETYGCYED